MAAVPTMTVLSADGSTVLINACDFDPSKHTCADTGATGDITADEHTPPVSASLPPTPPPPVAPAPMARRGRGRK